jgi:ribonuclease R
MKAAQKDDRLKLLEPLAIRTMAKAVYSTNNIGHYGLGFTHYSTLYLADPALLRRTGAPPAGTQPRRQGLPCGQGQTGGAVQARQCNQEKKAADAERESIKYKQAEYMRRHIGETFEGIISGMIDRGFFVELPESKAEGLVDFKYLDDAYEVQEGNLRAVGRRYKRQFKMGDRVRIRVVSVDLQKRQIEMELADSE